MFRPYMLVIFVYYTYSRTQLHFTQQYSKYTTTCFGPLCWPFLCITHTVEHKFISLSSTVGIQLHVSALYVGHFCVLHIQTPLYFTQFFSGYTTTCFGPICWSSSDWDLIYRVAIQDMRGVLVGYWGLVVYPKRNLFIYVRNK